jgi:hypothetical protein
MCSQAAQCNLLRSKGWHLPIKHSPVPWLPTLEAAVVRRLPSSRHELVPSITTSAVVVVVLALLVLLLLLATMSLVLWSSVAVGTSPVAAPSSSSSSWPDRVRAVPLIFPHELEAGLWQQGQ